MLKSTSVVKVKLVKTLPHLIPLHLSQTGAGLYASAYSPQIAKYLSQVFPLTEKFTYQQLTKLLTDLQWERVNNPYQPQTYSVHGDTISLWPIGYTHPVRIEFEFDKLQQVYTYDEQYGRKLYRVDQILLSPEKLTDSQDIAAIHLNKDVSLDTAMFVQSKPSLIPQPELVEWQEYDFVYPALFWSRLDLFGREVKRLEEQGYSVHIQTRHLSHIPDDIFPTPRPHPLWEYVPADLDAGFVSIDQKIAVFTDREIFGTVYISKQKVSNTNTSKLLSQFEGEISVGDYVVHEDYGVAVYAGLTQDTVDSLLREYLHLKYAADDELLVPINQVGKLTRYIGNDGQSPRLSRLGQHDWEQTTAKVKRSVLILAKELVTHYAERELAKSDSVFNHDTAEYNKFVDSFPYTETEDQLRATNEIISDLQSSTPMNRLLVGDVGFGKTEVMMRAAFKVAEAGMQAAILCPTTVLCAQHYGVFTKRFEGTLYKIAYLSRFNSAKQNAEIVSEVNAGNIDIIIGTHALLRSDLQFHKLGLLVVDEEQRFGVRQKEKIKKLNYGVHHLAVSATPIPRTLGMALSNIQEISLITMPPVGRKPINTTVAKLDWEKAVDAIDNEVQRGGQVYFVHNHVQDIAALYRKLTTLLPQVRITFAHGQMPPNDLDKRITDFYMQKFDVLLCTTIIENGLDMPNVNTIVIHQAERFGLSQLYQLRGRVGRSDRQAFCYLFYSGKELTPDMDAEGQGVTTEGQGDKVTKRHVEANYIKRLQAMAEATELGAGFNVASRDLEIRGAGNLLGAEQHGHISNIGYALYMQMLGQEIERLKALKESTDADSRNTTVPILIN